MVDFFGDIFCKFFGHTYKNWPPAAVNILIPSLQLLAWHKIVLKQPFDLKMALKFAKFTGIGQNRLELRAKSRFLSVVFYQKSNKTCLECAPKAQKIFFDLPYYENKN